MLFRSYPDSSSKTYRELFREIVYPTDDYDYEINTSWIAFHDVRSKWVSDKFIETFGPRRKPEGAVEDYHKHVACALQNRLEEIILEQLKKCKEKFNLKKLCFAGGIALNCSLNGKILESKIFDEIFVPPASGDNGTAIGACYLSTKNQIPNFSSTRLDNYYTGSEFSDDEIENSLNKKNVKYSKPQIFEKFVAEKLKEQKIIGWFQEIGRAHV